MVTAARRTGTAAGLARALAIASPSASELARVVGAREAEMWQTLVPTSALWATEVRDTWAPLAARIGLNDLGGRLEDTALWLLDPARFTTLLSRIEDRIRPAGRDLPALANTIRAALTAAGVAAQVTARRKTVASVARKVAYRHVPLPDIMDLLGVRAIVAGVDDCYRAAGALTAMCGQIHGSSNDYIMSPKESGYQSLHLALPGPGGVPIEVQIRTWDMHARAELGPAAHWRYKTGQRPQRTDAGARPAADPSLPWMRELIDRRAAADDPAAFLHQVATSLP